MDVTASFATEQISLAKGQGSLAIILIMIIVVTVFFMYKAIKGFVPELRSLAAVEALKECVARVAEVGGAIHISPGSDTGTPGHPETIAAIAFISHVARLAAEYDVPIIATACRGDVYPIVDGVVKAAAVAAGKPYAYNPANVRFLAQDQWAYTAGVLGIMNRENIKANFQFGVQRGSGLMIASAAHDVGAIQVSGAVSTISSLVPVSDYLLIAEEFIAGAAMLRKDPVTLSSIAAQDVSKAFIIILTIVGAILSAMNVTWLANFLKW